MLAAVRYHYDQRGQQNARKVSRKIFVLGKNVHLRFCAGVESILQVLHLATLP